ncbi:Crp/Fnr family transcriptional regulator [Deinococcus sp. KSM4-11]|nr:Crp/Fnr family transcriptional regulator [Deinococcus sp. KSM4-11]
MTMLGDLARNAHFRSYGRNETVFAAGDPADTLHIVALGSVRLYRTGRNGTRELTLSVEGSRQVIEPTALLGASVNHVVHAQALGQRTDLLILPGEIVRHAVLHTPTLGAAVMTVLARREADTGHHLDSLAFSGVGSRLAAYLLRHARTPHALPTNSELAALLGTVPEIVSRKLGDYYRLGWIDLARRTVTVTNDRELRQLAESG